MGNEIVGFGADMGGEVEIEGSNSIIDSCCEVYFGDLTRYFAKFIPCVVIGRHWIVFQLKQAKNPLNLIHNLF